MAALPEISVATHLTRSDWVRIWIALVGTILTLVAMGGTFLVAAAGYHASVHSELRVLNFKVEAIQRAVGIHPVADRPEPRAIVRARP